MRIEIWATLFAVLLFAGMLVMLEIGRRLGLRQRALNVEGASVGVGAVDAAIFGLLGLLVAFTFQGAAARFDARRALIVAEANAIGTAWLRIDLLPDRAQPAMRDRFRKYLDSRLETYRRIPDMTAVAAEIDRTAQLQQEIWGAAVAVQNEDGGQRVVVGLLPALNQMFDLVTARTMAARSHPPVVVFLMLAALAFVSALLAGHGMAGSKVRSWVHIICFAAILSTTVYVIMDMEFPRVGLIRVDDFDHALVEARRGMK